MAKEKDWTPFVALAALVGFAFFSKPRGAGAAVLGPSGATVPAGASRVSQATLAELRIAFARSESKYGLPDGLLESMARVESDLDPDIIYCRVLGGAGEEGIMQITPRWHPGVDGCDPFAAIDYAGSYLRKLFDEWGNWRYAVVAYNWGTGNLSRQGYLAMPEVTKRYIDRVASEVDIG